VTRTQVIALARERGLGVEEGRYPVAALAGADEAWASSSLRELMPIVVLDGAPIGDGRPGPAAAMLQDALRSLALG
jgi:branched-subunit amino acid aminotransferase/4-amino-4-deoxychorismate lyase